MLLNEYLQSYESYFWQWEEDAEIIAIPGANTIAYTQFVKEAIQLLAPIGLPPFGSLLLAIVATNPEADSSLETIKAILNNTFTEKEPAIFKGAFEFLKLLSVLPEKYKTGSNRLLVFQVIFEKCHSVISLKSSNRIARNIVEEKLDKERLQLKLVANEKIFKLDLRTIEILKTKFSSTQDIIDKVASLPSFHNDELVLEQTEPGAEDFIDRLIENPKTFFVGALVKRIWSGLAIPFHCTLAGNHPIGGFSDLTNKGDFDKLLIGEFANEDIVFLSRLANNEALFMHREIPPLNNNMERILLIDMSLKNWGTPKIIAFATALALIKHPKTNVNCKVFLLGDNYTLVSLESIDEVIKSLNYLNGNLNPVKGLYAFFKDFPNGKEREVVFIGEGSVLKQPVMANAMSECHSLIQYWIYTNSEGHLDLYKKQQQNKKHLQHLELPLTELWQKRSNRVQFNKEASISHKSGYPILFRNAYNVKKTLLTNEGEVFQITGEKTLMRLFSKTEKMHERGWEIIAEDLPFSFGEYEIGLLNNGDYVLLMFNPQNREITLLNLTSGENKYLLFSVWKKTDYPAFVFYNQQFYHFNFTGIWSIDIEGKVKQDTDLNKKVIEQKADDLRKLNSNQFSSGILKNITDLYINQHKRIVFNQHELYLNSSGHIKIEQKQDLLVFVAAKKRSDTEYVFPDGSSITINRLGMFILESSGKDIPVIYVPAILNASLGLASPKHFSGNEYYFQEPLFDLILEETSGNHLEILSLIKTLTGKGLSEVHSGLNQTPYLVKKHLSKTEAEQFKISLENLGAKVSLNLSINAGSYEVQKISTALFFENYINAFVNVILKHGT